MHDPLNGFYICLIYSLHVSNEGCVGSYIKVFMTETKLICESAFICICFDLGFNLRNVNNILKTLILLFTETCVKLPIQYVNVF
jgi:hypothetical protein